MTTPVTSSAYRAYVLFILVVVYTFNFIDRQIVGILAIPIKEELALSDIQLSLMGGLAFALFYTFLGIPIAALADRKSRTWIMTIALSVWSAMTALCGLAQNFTQLFLARLGVGVGEAGGVAPAEPVDQPHPAGRARYGPGSIDAIPAKYAGAQRHHPGDRPYWKWKNHHPVCRPARDGHPTSQCAHH